MPNAAERKHAANLAHANSMKQSLAHIKIGNDGSSVWAGDGVLWVNNDDGETVLDIALGSNPRREAISRLHTAGYTIVEIVTPTLFVVQKR